MAAGGSGQAQPEQGGRPDHDAVQEQRSTLTPAAYSACPKPGPEPEEKRAHHPP